MERIVQLPDLVGLYSEIIVIDESVGLDTRNIMDHISSLSSGVNVQISQSNEQLQQDVGHAIDQVNTHVEEQQAALDSNTQANPGMLPTSTPQVIVNAPSPNPTAVPPTQVPPTPIPATPTLIPTATLFPEVLSIVSHSNNQTLQCNSQGECIINVSIQWVPDSQRQNRNLTVWVRPLPDQADGTGQDYWPQNPPQHIGNGVWQVTGCVVGQPNDPNGTKFAIYAIVTYDYYGPQAPLTTLPANIKQFGINVFRGTP